MVEVRHWERDGSDGNWYIIIVVVKGKNLDYDSFSVRYSYWHDLSIAEAKKKFPVFEHVWVVELRKQGLL